MARISFIELPSSQVAASEHFFAEAFGWQMTSFGPTYSCTMTGDVDLGLQADTSEATKAPLTVITVDDLQDTYAKVLTAGGQISKETFSFPGGRRFHFLDPSGNELAAMQVDQA